MQRLLLAAKDTVERGAVTLLGRLLAGFLFGSPAMQSYDVILPVPFHPRGLRGRPVHPLTAIYLDAAPVLRSRFPLDDLAPRFSSRSGRCRRFVTGPNGSAGAPSAVRSRSGCGRACCGERASP